MAVEPRKPGVALERACRRPQPAPRGPVRPRLEMAGQLGQVRVDRAQRIGAEVEPIHDAGREILDQDVGFGGEGAGGHDRLGQLQIEDDRLLGLAEHGMKLGRAAGVAAGRRASTLMAQPPSRRDSAGRRRPGDDPGKIEDADAAQRQVAGGWRGLIAPRHWKGRRARSGARTVLLGDLDRGGRNAGARAAGRQARSPARAQREARDMGFLRLVGDPLLVDAAGSIPTSARAARRNWRRGRAWSRSAARRPNRAASP